MLISGLGGGGMSIFLAICKPISTPQLASFLSDVPPGAALEARCRTSGRGAVLVVGLGGGGLPAFLATRCRMSVDCVELDPVVAQLARQQFGLPEGERLRVCRLLRSQVVRYLSPGGGKADAGAFDLPQGETWGLWSLDIPLGLIVEGDPYRSWRMLGHSSVAR